MTNNFEYLWLSLHPYYIQYGLKSNGITKKGINATTLRNLSMPDIKKEWKGIFQNVDKKNLKLDEKDTASEIKAYRKAKQKKASARWNH